MSHFPQDTCRVSDLAENWESSKKGCEGAAFAPHYHNPPLHSSGANPQDHTDTDHVEPDFPSAKPTSKSSSWKPQLFNSSNLMQVFCRDFLRSRTAVGSFCRKSLVLQDASNMQPSRSKALWPVPLPRWRWTACMHLGPRRRRRKRELSTRHLATQLIIACLNWEVLGHPVDPPPEGCLGYPISDAQHLIIEHIESLVDHHLSSGDFTEDDLGRFLEKYQGVIKMLEELPHCHSSGEDLTSVLIDLQADLDPYNSHFGGRVHHRTEDKPKSDHQCTFDRSAPLPMSGARPVISSRIKWQFPPSFEAEAYLTNPLVKAAFEDPEVMRKPKEFWSPSKPAKINCSKAELLDLAKRWDDLGAIRLLPADQKCWEEAVGMFAVAKDSQFDRLIINPQNLNGRMWTVSDSTKSLAPGCMLGLLHLQEGECFRFCADDLSDFYYTFKVSERRASRNAFRFRFKPSELEHLHCFKPEHRRHNHLLICLSTLAMGDNLAVEIAQQAHANVLRVLCGSMLDSETLRYRHPIPRGDFVELLAIDDHVGIQRLLSSQLPEEPSLRDTHVFQLAAKAYKSVGLVQQKKKQKRNCTQGTILGADFDGVKGRVMAPRSRILLLSGISMKIVSQGTCTRRLLNLVVGCWVHVLLFRRVLFSVIDSLFTDGLARPLDQVFCLNRQSLNELQVLAMLGPTAQSDLRVHYSKFLYTTDASPSGGAVVRAEIGPKAAQEVWRHTEQKGFYTKLQSPVSVILSEHGIEPESMHMFQDHLAHHSLKAKIPSSLSEGWVFDCIEIFRGVGNWSTAHRDVGLAVHDGIDLDGRRLRVGDITSDSVFRELTALAARRVIRDWHAGVPCPSFGTLRRPQVRSLECPFGFDPKDSYTAYHNKMAQRAAIVLILALKHGSFISVEQPRNSRLFHLHLYKVLVQLGCVLTQFAFCYFGSGFHKPSRWLHNKPWLVPLECQCKCEQKGKHFVVQGTFTKTSISLFDEKCRPNCEEVYGCSPYPGQRVSEFSAAYPLRLVQAMAVGSLQASKGHVDAMPLQAIHMTAQSLEIPLEDVSPVPPSEVPFPNRPWFEDPEWVGELCESLLFREVFRFNFKKSGHINVNETRTYKSWIKHMAKSERDCRFTGLLDSRVTLGASAKGRSSSFAISRVLQGSLAYIIGGNLYPGGLHCYSAFNRADAPSRGRPVQAPTKEKPKWFELLEKGDPSLFDIVVASSCVARVPGRWMRFIMLILAGDVERNPGPMKPGTKVRPRGVLDLKVGFAEQTSNRMIQCVSAFQQWVENFCELSFENLVSDSQAVGWALRAYGVHLFERGFPRYLFVYAITGMQEQFPQCRPGLGLAWQIDRKWQIHEPGQCRAVLPGIAIRAVCAVGTLWGWHFWVGVILLGFAAMLHPSEMVALTRKDLVFPRDVGFDMPCLYIHLQNPKTARFARRQHGRIDDTQIIQLAEKIFGKLPMQCRLYSGSISLFRKQWDAVMSLLGIPHRQSQRGATPGTLRGSGATFLYGRTEDIPWIAWRGRWARVKTLEFYLQEVSAQLLLHELPKRSKHLVETFGNAAWPILCTQWRLLE